MAGAVRQTVAYLHRIAYHKTYRARPTVVHLPQSAHYILLVYPMPWSQRFVLGMRCRADHSGTGWPSNWYRQSSSYWVLYPSWRVLGLRKLTSSRRCHRVSCARLLAPTYRFLCRISPNKHYVDTCVSCPQSYEQRHKSESAWRTTLSAYHNFKDDP